MDELVEIIRGAQEGVSRGLAGASYIFTIGGGRREQGQDRGLLRDYFSVFHFFTGISEAGDETKGKIEALSA